MIKSEIRNEYDEIVKEGGDIDTFLERMWYGYGISEEDIIYFKAIDWRALAKEEG